MAETQTGASAQAGSATNGPASGNAGQPDTGAGQTPQIDQQKVELEKKLGEQGRELGEYRTFVQQISPLLTVLDKNPEFAQAIASGKIDDKLMKAVVEGKVKVEDATAAVAAHEQVKKDMGAQAYAQATPQEIQKAVVDQLTGQIDQRFRDAEELKDFEDNVTTFIGNTDDFKEYADDIQKWLEQHTDIDDIETAYWAVKGQKLAAGQSSAQGEGAKRIAQNAGGGAAPASGQIPTKVDLWDQLVAPRTDPNRI